MKINFTKKEYRLLLDTLYVSDWVMHSYAMNQIDNDYQQLRKKILSYYKTMDAADRIEYSVEDDEYYEQGAYDTAMQEQFIEPYEENYFWDELMDRLGRRDVIERIGMAAYEALDIKERIQTVELAKEKYANEFEQHGLAALKIIREKPAH